MKMARTIEEKLDELAAKYSACDISDALLKLSVGSPPNKAGFLADIRDIERTIPRGTPYADIVRPNTMVIISQPSGQSNAVVGGIMATRMMRRGVRGVIVDGRVRDVDVLGALDTPIWAKGLSAVGAGADSVAWATDVPIAIGGVEIVPDDIAFIDPVANGIVVIPRLHLDAVLDVLPKLVEADRKVLEHVAAGGTVAEAFEMYR